MQHLHLSQPINASDWQAQSTAQSAKIKPASLALLLQMSAACSVFLLVWLVREIAQLWGFNLTLSVFAWVLMHSVLSTLYAYIAKQAHWWRWIHFGFAFAVWGMMQIQLPSEIYLACFIVTTGIFWTTFRSQVPFFPSRPAVWQEIEQLIPQHRPTRVIDIGSGLGDMAMYIANQRPLCQAEGIEIAPLPWVVSQVRGFFKQSRARFKLGDYYDLNFADYDIIFAYLSPVAMPLLWNKAMQEMKPGSLLVSLEFEIEQMQPTNIITPKDQSPNLYVWRM
ncbi:MAG TPA: class I SAM-dependent methyltransferase [Methylotenera sp.]|nr:class I SAM-dependent methyltransferase [Methylotenera sp.]HPH04940.1 class I SAM-dependent methyltransferase [Methylotenera sp.]HPN01736.1 class I SAM-dependent methyltransferase [Methylotenera sp.]